MLRESALRPHRRSWRRDPDPMEGLANLADVMLVFACGLMVSMLLHWNVDLRHVVVSQDELKEIGEYQAALDSGAIAQDMESKGVAYEDPETGKLYIIMP